VAHWLQHTSRDGDMQLHVHSQIAHTARTSTDGKWRAPDSLGCNEHIGAVAAIVSQHLEEALTRRFGVAWEARDDGHGFEIRGIPGQMMRLFSSRRESITADLRARAARFEQQYGRAPSQRELARLAQASNFATRAAKERALDLAEHQEGWADKLARTLGVSLASVAPLVWHDFGAGYGGARLRGLVPGQLEVSRAAQKAVALAQQEKSTWTRADLIKYLGRVLPRSGMNPAAAAALLEEVADRALRSEFEPVACLEAPEPVAVPARLLRADGRSVYQRHGGVRFAAQTQLTMEERMVALARAGGAPCMDRAEAALALGADLAQLDRALAGRVQDAQGRRTRTGLREDQAAAALSVLTDGKRVSVLNAPAGSGKTWVLAAAGRAWVAAGLGRAIGITPSQSARNTLAAGVPESYNTAQFLGHLRRIGAAHLDRERRRPACFRRPPRPAVLAVVTLGGLSLGAPAGNRALQAPPATGTDQQRSAPHEAAVVLPLPRPGTGPALASGLGAAPGRSRSATRPTGTSGSSRPGRATRSLLAGRPWRHHAGQVGWGEAGTPPRLVRLCPVPAWDPDHEAQARSPLVGGAPPTLASESSHRRVEQNRHD
jgi:hypothetical protein